MLSPIPRPLLALLCFSSLSSSLPEAIRWDRNKAAVVPVAPWVQLSCLCF